MAGESGVFVPGNALEAAIHRGDYNGVLQRLEEIPPSKRPEYRTGLQIIHKIIEVTRWSPHDPDLLRRWGSGVSSMQYRCLEAARFVCGRGEDVSCHYLKSEDLIELGHRFHPSCLQEHHDIFWHWYPTRDLMLAGLIERPTSERYYLTLMHCNRWGDIYKEIAVDPGLLGEPLLRLLELEGTSDTSLAGCDKYAKEEHSWIQVFLKYSREGVYSRDLLLAKTLDALEKDWPQFRSGWFSRFHAALAPTPEEMAPHAERYLGLCHSRIPPTVSMALEAVSQLYQAGKITDVDVMPALLPVLTASAKVQVDNALKLLDRIVKDHPARAQAASAIALRGLQHEAPDIHKKVLARLKKWTFDDAARDELHTLLPHVSAANRDTLVALIGEPADSPPVIEAHTAPAEAARGNGPLDPLSPERALRPIGSVAELVETIAACYENPKAADDLERVLDALVRLAPFDADDIRLFGPVLKRAKALKTPYAWDLGCFVTYVVTGEDLPRPPPFPKSNYHVAQQTPLHALILRLEGLRTLAAEGLRLSPLAAPTHRRGFIDPARFIERLAEHLAAGAALSRLETACALMRLPPGPRPDLLTQARRLPDSVFTRAVRYALGDDVPVGDDALLFAAAARIRHPEADDDAVIARFGDLGPNAGHAARYVWSWHMENPESPYAYAAMTLSTWPPQLVPDPDLFPLQRRQTDSGEQNPFYAASLSPGNLDSFFADWGHSICANLKWSEANWASGDALTLMLDPTVPVTPMALLTLAVGLADKEAGRLATAVDVLATAWREGRLESRTIGVLMRDLLATPLVTAARYRKALDAVRLQNPAVVFEILCDLVCANPEQPPKDTAALLELLLELKLDLARPLPDHIRAALASMVIGGKGKGLVKQLLA